ncbi:hypothetical protein ABLN67_20895 [Mycobacterium tuberculosis]
MFNRFIYRREWSFRIYRETLSRFSCRPTARQQLITAQNTHPHQMQNPLTTNRESLHE